MTLSSFFWFSLGAALGGLGMWPILRRRIALAELRQRDAEDEQRRERHRNRIFHNIEPYKFCHLNELVGPDPMGER